MDTYFLRIKQKNFDLKANYIEIEIEIDRDRDRDR